MKKIRKKTSLLIGTLCAVPLALSAQQGDIDAVLKACAAIDDDGQRLSCYDQVLRPEKTPDRTALPATTDYSEESGPVKAVQEQRDSQETAAAAAAAAAAGAAQVNADQPAAKPAPAEVPEATETFGLKEKQPRESVSITVTVNGIRKNLNNRFVYTTAEGQVWLQIDKRRVHYDEVPFVAEIRSAALGSFYLKPESDGVSVRVRREK
jgi:pyruvate/2-oxoglutarate dehydrogenase complex dihydrolipoamide acyltransferase (E2) component